MSHPNLTSNKEEEEEEVEEEGRNVDSLASLTLVPLSPPQSVRSGFINIEY